MIKHQYRMSDLHTIKDLTRIQVRGTSDVVAKEFPNKLSKPLSSEYE